MKYFIEYNNIPTARNIARTIETDNLELFVHITGENRVYFTDYAKRIECINENTAIIERIYQENIVYYQQNIKIFINHLNFKNYMNLFLNDLQIVKNYTDRCMIQIF